MELTTYLRFLLALIAVLALIGILAWLARRYGFGGVAATRPGGRIRRLGIVEVLPIDARRRLVLIRRDGVEQLEGGGLLLDALHGIRVVRHPPPGCGLSHEAPAAAARPTTRHSARVAANQGW